jgi:hypothetical protein
LNAEKVEHPPKEEEKMKIDEGFPSVDRGVSFKPTNTTLNT